VVKLNHQVLLFTIGYGRSMSIPAGTYALGPADASLRVLTRRVGAASKAGHDLVIEVGSWQATLTTGESGDGANLVVTADSRSLRVLEGTGGIKPLTGDDKASIKRTIDEEVLRGTSIEFRSTAITSRDGGLAVEGELELAGRRNPLSFDVSVAADGRLRASATVRQTVWGMKPYSALFGTLKVLDEVRVVAEGTLRC
jgi:polyisoprenoid-binding protein YceI